MKFTTGTFIPSDKNVVQSLRMYIHTLYVIHLQCMYPNSLWLLIMHPIIQHVHTYKLHTLYVRTYVTHA